MITKIEDLAGAKGTEVALPGFTLGEQFTVKLRRPSLMRLAQEGRIPNQLLGTAATLFNEGMSKNMLDDGERFKELSDMVICLAKAAMVDPSYDELDAAGIGLTDEQLFHIYMFTQKGVQMLDVFRKEQGTESDTEPVGSEGQRSKRDHADRR